MRSVLDIGPPLDWHDLWMDGDDQEDWIVEPLIAAGRLVSIYSAPKTGKSLLLLGTGSWACQWPRCARSAAEG
jgi:hypothetical protein